MNDLLQRIANIDWQAVTEILAEKGYTAVSQFLPVQNCNELIAEYDNSDLYRKTITMEKYRFGLGEYKYFKYPLPETSWCRGNGLRPNYINPQIYRLIRREG